MEPISKNRPVNQLNGKNTFLHHLRWTLWSILEICTTSLGWMSLGVLLECSCHNIIIYLSSCNVLVRLIASHVPLRLTQILSSLLMGLLLPMPQTTVLLPAPYNTSLLPVRTSLMSCSWYIFICMIPVSLIWPWLSVLFVTLRAPWTVVCSYFVVLLDQMLFQLVVQILDVWP